MDVGLNTKILAIAIVGMLLLTACLAQTVTPIKEETDQQDASVQPFPSIMPTVTASLVATQQPSPTVTATATSLPTQTLIPTLPSCKAGGLLFLHNYLQQGQYVRGLFWACSTTSITQLIASGTDVTDIAVSPSGSQVALAGITLQVMDISTRKMVTYLEAAPKEGIYHPSALSIK